VKPQTAAAPDPRENGDLPWHELVLRYVAAAAGTLLRWIYGAGLLAIAGLVSRWPWIGNVVIGLFPAGAPTLSTTLLPAGWRLDGNRR
jgi:hypothetical protein